MNKQMYDEMFKKLEADHIKYLYLLNQVDFRTDRLERYLPDGWVITYNSSGILWVSKYSPLGDEKNNSLEFREVCNHVERMFDVTLKRDVMDSEGGKVMLQGVSLWNTRHPLRDKALEGLDIFVQLFNADCRIEWKEETINKTKLVPVVAPECLGL